MMFHICPVSKFAILMWQGWGTYSCKNHRRPTCTSKEGIR